jgi:hypothetical protein
LIDLLASRLAPRDLHSLLLAVFASRASSLSPQRLLDQYASNRFVTPSPADPRKLSEIDRLAWTLLPEHYAPVELSPVCPLGTASAVADISQHKVISTIGNTEVVSDSTNVLALECAARRRPLLNDPIRRTEAVLLATSHRLLRGQPFSGPGAWAHFRMFCLCAGGRRQGAFGFESAHVVEQVLFYVRLLQALGSSGSPIGALRVAITDVSDGALARSVDEHILRPLRARAPDVSVCLDATRSSGRQYYDGVCFAIFVTDDDGSALQLVDGGSTNWIARLLNDRSERLVISGINAERICSLSAPEQNAPGEGTSPPAFTR